MATTIRKATAADAEALAEVSASTFYDTFVQFNTAEDMDAYMSAAFSVAQQVSEIADARAAFFLAFVDDEVAGYAKVIESQAPACVTLERPVELERMYARSRFHGQGVAARLMEACLEEARARGGASIWLGVWERNPRAIAFYEKCGFATCGSKIFQLGSDPQVDVVMARPL